MKYSKEPGISALVKQFIGKGWQFQKGRKHGKLIAPWGRAAVIPATPSDRRAYLNLRSQLRRMEASPC
ncbi:hypothetical protein FCL40_01175 [Ferrimonas sediminicola]|uniref:HicA toxin of toxin-antitoxin n=1 Tax=Ferrimonas sediminicola TaxID=2569538 RepID=A0A4U1BM52_9GAMM|nr:hypothetical protein [Ferrimonas sediminicola]TKB51198.1 hypothetical protein FCL40_01175 [Ferrimonas sediminicola]